MSRLDFVPSLYDWFINRDVLREPQHTLIQGGPGMGKTVVLLELRARVQSVPAFERSTVTLHSHRESREVIEWLENPEGVLLVDNIDLMYGPPLETALRNFHGEHSGTEHVWLIVTSGHPVRSRDIEMDARADHPIFDSLGMTPFEQHWLNPWKSQWKAYTATRLYDSLTAQLHHQHRDPSTRARPLPSQEEIQPSLDKLVDQTGGHPTLVGQGAKLLVDEFTDSDPDSPVGEKDSERTLFDTAAALAPASIQWATTILGAPIVSQFLETIDEQSPAIAVEVADLLGRRTLQVLELAGVVRRPDPATIACRALHAALIGIRNQRRMQRSHPVSGQDSTAVAPATSVTRVELQSVEDGVRNKGELRWTHLGTRYSLQIPRAECELLEVLMERPGEPMTVDDLVEGLQGLSRERRGDEPASVTTSTVTSRLQRLMKRLRDEQLDHLVANEPRKGYVFHGRRA
ncbi:MAG: hypothetical protein AB1Z98_18040 [Nannocystaceae bacterium]